MATDRDINIRIGDELSMTINTGPDPGPRRYHRYQASMCVSERADRRSFRSGCEG